MQPLPTRRNFLKTAGLCLASFVVCPISSVKILVKEKSTKNLYFLKKYDKVLKEFYLPTITNLLNKDIHLADLLDEIHKPSPSKITILK